MDMIVNPAPSLWITPCRACGSQVLSTVETVHELAEYVVLGALCGTCQMARERQGGA